MRVSPDGSWILELSGSAPIKANVRAWHGNFHSRCRSNSLALCLSFFLSKRVDAKCPRLCLLTRVCAYSCLSTYLHVYGVSQIKRSFAKRPSRPASSELIIATSAYQRPRAIRPCAIHSPQHRETPRFFAYSQRLRKGCVV